MKKTALSLALIGAVALVTACSGESSEDSGNAPATLPTATDVEKTVEKATNAAEETADAVTETAGTAAAAVADVANADLQTLTFSVSGMS